MILNDKSFEPRPAYAYIVGKRKQATEEPVISAEELDEIKEYMKKYFGGIDDNHKFSNY